MKKIITIASLLSVLAGASAFAKTEGSYLGLDLHRSALRSKEMNKTFPTTGTPQYQETSKTGVGISYKYAINFDNKFFIAPGVFWERLNNKNLKNDDEQAGYGASYISANNRYGARADFGYDITDSLAAYVTAGVANVGYTTYVQDAHANTAGPNKNIKTHTGMMYGVGMMSKINDQLSLGVEYNTQRFAVKNHDQGSDIRTKSTLDLYKVTLAYHF